MTKPLDLTKPLRTRGGLGELTIYCTDAPGPFSIHGRITANGISRVCSWAKSGYLSGDPKHPHQEDLINEPESTVRWVNVYENQRGALSIGELFESKEQADILCHSEQRIGRIRIDDYRRFDE